MHACSKPVVAPVNKLQPLKILLKSNLVVLDPVYTEVMLAREPEVSCWTKVELMVLGGLIDFSWLTPSARTEKPLKLRPFYGFGTGLSRAAAGLEGKSSYLCKSVGFPCVA